MNLLMYNSLSKGPGMGLEKALGALTGGGRVKIRRTVGELFRGLRQPGSAPGIAILQAADMGDLQDILPVRKYLGDARLILILPDMEKETVAKAHQLRPRVLMEQTCDPSEILAIVEKMMRRDGERRLASRVEKE